MSHEVFDAPVKSIRNQFGEALVKIGTLYPNVMVSTAELMYPTRTDAFAKAYPKRFYDVGIAEQNLFGIAAGLATCGKIPIACSYANFSCLRAGEQIRNDISYTNLNVKVVALSSGLTFGIGGASHQSYEDLAVMRSLPNFVVLSPADALSIEKAIFAAVSHDGPVYIRAGRDEEYVVYEGDDMDFTIGKANTLREGDDIGIVATGYMVHEALVAADSLKERNISAHVLDIHTIKPFDKEAVCAMAKRVNGIITIEEHNYIGGLGTAVLEALDDGFGIPVVRIGLMDCYPPIGPTFALRRSLGLDSSNIIEKALKILDK